jgi:hypothetical protein
LKHLAKDAAKTKGEQKKRRREKERERNNDNNKYLRLGFCLSINPLSDKFNGRDYRFSIKINKDVEFKLSHLLNRAI